MLRMLIPYQSDYILSQSIGCLFPVVFLVVQKLWFNIIFFFFLLLTILGKIFKKKNHFPGHCHELSHFLLVDLVSALTLR